ncbi:chitinase 2 [Podospora australis]|uniref:Chitinase 2 n=1 Tax=Podospora australis TaxID=1536484 RepID=A0AAN6X3Z4_9PEZI|nr:chitinase 2 [Podospora australis]
MPPIPSRDDSPPLPRLITYYQTHHTPESEGGKHISVLPLVTQPGIHLTHLILAAIHLNENPEALTLNDHHPSHERFTTLWAELRVLQACGVKVLGMLGGAAKGSFTRLDQDEATFELYYAPLFRLVKERNLDGLDLDVEEKMSLAGIIRLIDRMKQDFGGKFIITLAPVASALLSVKHNLSGFDYEALEVMRGDKIAWYNAQFYCGWGDVSSPVMYEMILAKGWKSEKVVVGLVTNPENGSGWVPFEGLGNVLPLIVGRHPGFGGVMGWEYFNSLPGGKERPWEWAKRMTGLLRGRRSAEGDENIEGGRRGRDQQVVTDGESKKEGNVDLDGEEDEQDVSIPKAFEYHSDGMVEEEEEL